MDLNKFYEDLYRKSINEIGNGSYETDNLIDSPNDKRRGITLLFRPSSEIRAEVSRFLHKMRQIDPNQYYYPESDMHITVLSIISCHPEFKISTINLPAYINLLRKAVSTANSFTIEFRGITVSPSCVMVRGFPHNEILNDLRNGIRSCFRKSSLENSIDRRYVLKTAHSTIVRFKEKISDIPRYKETLDLYKDFYFGSCTVNSLELVVNDWYLRDANTQKLFDFSLRGNYPLRT